MNNYYIPLKKSLLSVAIASFVSPTLHAAPSENSQVHLLDQVTITATRTEQTLDDVAASVAVKTSEDIEKNMDKDIRDLMKYEPGVEVGSDGRFGLKGFNVRGMDGNRVKIMVDGVDQPKSFDPYQNLFLKSNRNFIDVETIKQVEVVKGPGSTLYGSDALGGVVSFATKDPADFLKPEGDNGYFSLKGDYNSADRSYSETMTMAGRGDRLETLLIYTRRDGHETKTMGKNDVKGFARDMADPSNNSMDSVLAKMKYQLNDAHRFGLTMEYLNGESDTDNQSMNRYGGYHEEMANPPNPSFGDTHNDFYYSNFKSENLSKSFKVGIDHHWQADNSLFDTLSWQLNWQKAETNNKSWYDYRYSVNVWVLGNWRRVSDKTSAKYKNYTYEQEDISFDAQFSKLINTGFDQDITYGLVVKKEDQENINYSYSDEAPESNGHVAPIGRYAPIATVDSLGVYFQDAMYLTDKLTVTPGIRYDWFQTNPSVDQYYAATAGVSSLKSRTDNQWTGQIGSVYDFTDIWSGFAQLSQGFRAPDIMQMYFGMDGDGKYEIRPNPDLKSETSSAFETGIRANGGLGAFETTVFYTDYKDYIDYTYEGQIGDPQIIQYQNIADATIKGVEMKGQLWLDELLGMPMGTSFRSSLSYTEGEGQQKGEAVKPLNSIAPMKGVFGLTYDAPSEKWGTEVMLTLVAAKKEKDINQNDINNDTSGSGADADAANYAPAGYGVVDFTGYYKPTKDITVRGGIFNIEDKEYYIWDDVVGVNSDYEGMGLYSQPGRNVSVSLKWEI